MNKSLSWARNARGWGGEKFLRGSLECEMEGFFSERGLVGELKELFTDEGACSVNRDVGNYAE